MSKEVDLRNFRRSRATASIRRRLRKHAEATSQKLPGKHTVEIEDFDPLTGNSSRVVSRSAPRKKKDYIQRALEHLHATRVVRGLSKNQASEYNPSPVRQETSAGAVAVHVQQQYKGINIFQADQTVLFAPNGSVERVMGSSVTIKKSKQVSPAISAKEVTLAAANYLTTPSNEETEPDEEREREASSSGDPSIDLSGFEPEVAVFTGDTSDMTTFFNEGPFDDKIKTRLLWFPLDNDLRLAWEVILALPDFGGRYQVLIDANSSEVLYCRLLSCQALARGNVFRLSPAFPRQMLPFPLALNSYGIPPSPPNLPPGLPDHWVLTNATAGNCSLVNLTNATSNLPPLAGAVVNGVVVFDPPESPGHPGPDQMQVNAFFYTCLMHDFFYLLGFREDKGNFQLNNFGRGGIQNDPVHTILIPGPVNGHAKFEFRIDGTRPQLKLGVTPQGRHTALDATMVFHEYTHGVTQRVIAGHTNPNVLVEPQSKAMGEGWSDYFACTVANTDAVGAWAVNNINGLRKTRYTSDLSPQVFHFGKIGTLGFTDPHDIGMVWCATLLEMNRRLGVPLATRLVFDALSHSNANPSFLDMRECILAALAHLKAVGEMSQGVFLEAKRQTGAAFSKFGMGPQAQTNGPSLIGIRPDFQMPPGV